MYWQREFELTSDALCVFIVLTLLFNAAVWVKKRCRK